MPPPPPPPTPLPPLDCLIGSHYVGTIIIIQGFFTAVPQSARALARGPVTRAEGDTRRSMPVRVRGSTYLLPTYLPTYLPPSLSSSSFSSHFGLRLIRSLRLALSRATSGSSLHLVSSFAPVLFSFALPRRLPPLSPSPTVPFSCPTVSLSGFSPCSSALCPCTTKNVAGVRIDRSVSARAGGPPLPELVSSPPPPPPLPLPREREPPPPSPLPPSSSPFPRSDLLYHIRHQHYTSALISSVGNSARFLAISLAASSTILFRPSARHPSFDQLPLFPLLLLLLFHPLNLRCHRSSPSPSSTSSSSTAAYAIYTIYPTLSTALGKLRV